MLINIHTHKRSFNENQLEIVVGEDTVGIHPWNVDKSLELLSSKEFCLMIGETGIDRSLPYKQTLELQKRYFIIHLEAAKFFNLPIVVHSVRAHSDIIEILKREKYSGKILFHDFYGNEKQVNDFLSFDSYFSLRRRFEVLNYLPINRVFLETDDQEEETLDVVYEKSGILKLQIEKNFLCFFDNFKHVRTSDIIEYLSLALKTYK